MSINPADATERAVKDGDWVWVMGAQNSSRAIMKALVTERVGNGVAWIVLDNKDQCIGCGYCFYACAFGALQYPRLSNFGSRGKTDKYTCCAGGGGLEAPGDAAEFAKHAPLPQAEPRVTCNLSCAHSSCAQRTNLSRDRRGPDPLGITSDRQGEKDIASAKAALANPAANTSGLPVTLGASLPRGGYLILLRGLSSGWALLLVACGAVQPKLATDPDALAPPTATKSWAPEEAVRILGGEATLEAFSVRLTAPPFQLSPTAFTTCQLRILMKLW